MGILLLNEILGKEGFSVDIFQGFSGKAHEHIRKAFAGNDPPRIIGLYSNYNNIRLVEHTAAALKKAHPEVTVIAGGPQLVALGEDFLRDSNVDIGCVGDADETLPELLKCLLRKEGSLEDIKGIFYFDREGRFIRTPDQRPPDLENSLWPDLQHAPELTRAGILPILTGRGCPFGCTFCYEGANSRQVRFHTIESTMEQIERCITENSDLKYVNFLDDTFTLNKDRLAEFCRRLQALREKYDFAWMCAGHVSTLHNRPELARAMADAGCLKIFFGLESGCDEVLEKFNKKCTRKMIEETLTMCVEQGINTVAGNIILGGPFETKETCAASVGMIEDLLRKLPGSFDASYVTFLPYPNTPITNCPEAYGMKIYPQYIDWDNEDMTLSETQEISREELQEIRLDAARRLIRIMQEIYDTGLVPDERILANYRLKGPYGLYTRWYEYIYVNMPIDHAYWRMRTSGSYCPSRELEKGAGFPERTFELWLEVGFRNNIPFIGKHELRAIEYELLKLCNGKLTHEEVSARAARVLGAGDGFPAEAEAALKRMEAYRWILYSKN